MHRLVTACLAVAVISVAFACSPVSAPRTPEPEATATQMPVSTTQDFVSDPTTEASAPRTEPLPLTVLEGRWACDVQRYAFKSLDDMETQLNGRLAAAGYSRDDYDVFKQRLSIDQDLTSEVSAEYAAYCDSDSSS